MTLMPSTTTWTTSFIHTPTLGLVRGQEPQRTLISDSWDALDQFVQTANGPVVGMIGYEMGGSTDAAFPIPTHPHLFPPLVFCEYTHLTPYTIESTKKPSKVFLDGCSDTKDSYFSKIEAIRDDIARGEYYQVNLSQEFRFTCEELDPTALFLYLYEKTKAPYAAYLDLGEYQICSLSPELFVKRERGEVTTRPIKGTIARGESVEEDQKNRERLLASKKDRAELMMICDLMRNDLTRVCDRGSVTVEELCELHAFRDIFHLMATVKGRSNRPSVEIVKTLFPAGSITGCPKRASMEAIYQYENRPRGAYTGSIGVFYPDGNFELNVAIRTLTLSKNEIRVPLGGAILYDSDPAMEYAETLHKGRSFFELLC